MHWEIFLIPLIAMGVWLLGTIFRNAEEERARMARRPPGDGGVRVPQRRPVTDLDRFLEEARRRREAGDKGRSPAPPPEVVVVPPQRVTRPAPAQEQRPQREAPRRPPRPVPTSAPPRPRTE